jgi:hypothetical protein
VVRGGEREEERERKREKGRKRDKSSGFNVGELPWLLNFD